MMIGRAIQLILSLVGIVNGAVVVATLARGHYVSAVLSLLILAGCLMAILLAQALINEGG